MRTLRHIDGSTYATLAFGILVALLVVVLSRRALRRSELPPAFVVLLSAAPLGFALLMRHDALRELHEGAFVYHVLDDLSPLGVARALARVHAGVALGHVVTGLALGSLALVVGVAYAGRRGTARALSGWLVAGTTALVLVAALGALAAHQRASGYDAYHLAEASVRAALLREAVEAVRPIVLARAALVVALVLALAVSLFRLPGTGLSRVSRATRTGALALGLLGLSVDVPVARFATERAIAALERPWSSGRDFVPLSASELPGDAWGTPYTPPQVATTAGPLVDLVTGRPLPAEGAALDDALRAIHRRLVAEEEAAWRLDPPPEAPQEEMRGGPYSAFGPAGGEPLRYGPPPWPGCDPADDGRDLVVALDRRTPALTLRELVRAAHAAGFGGIQFVGPAFDARVLAALEGFDPASAALVAHDALAFHFLLPGDCEVGSRRFVHAVVGSAPPSELEDSAGPPIAMSAVGLAALGSARHGRPPDVVLELGPDVTPLALAQTSVLLSTFVRAPVRVVDAPERLTYPAAPTPPPLPPGADAARVHPASR